MGISINLEYVIGYPGETIPVKLEGEVDEVNVPSLELVDETGNVYCQSLTRFGESKISIPDSLAVGEYVLQAKRDNLIYDYVQFRIVEKSSAIATRMLLDASLKQAEAFRELEDRAEPSSVFKQLDNASALYLEAGECELAPQIWIDAVDFFYEAGNDMNADFASRQATKWVLKGIRRCRSIKPADKGYDSWPSRIAAELFNLGECYRSKGNARMALALFRRARLALTREFGENHMELAPVLERIALLVHIEGNLPRAEYLYNRALSAWGAWAPEYQPELFAECLNNLALLHQTAARYEKARPLYERALEVLEDVLGPDNTRVALGLSCLAGLYQAEGRFSEARSLLLKALAIYEKSEETDPSGLVMALNNLGGVYQAEGRYEEALQLFSRALSTLTGTGESTGEDIGRTLNNLAALQQDQGKYDEALQLYERSLKIWKNQFGTNHPDVAIALNNMALAYQAKGYLDEAASLLEEALRIWTGTLGDYHPYAAKGLSNLALVYQAKGDHQQAIDLVSRALEIWERTLGPEHPDVATSLNNLAGLYQHEGAYERAEKLYARALIILTNAFGEIHPDIARNLSNRARLREAQGDHAQAMDFQMRAASIWQQTVGLSHPDAVAAQSAFSAATANAFSFQGSVSSGSFH